MSTFKKLVSLCILFGFVLAGTKAQLPYRIGSQKEAIVSSLSTDTIILTYKSLKALALPFPDNWIPTWTDKAKKPDFAFNTTNRNNYDIIHSLSFLNKSITILPWEITTMEITGFTGSPNSRRNWFTGQLFTDIQSIYFYPLKRTYIPSFSESCLYRNSALILMSIMQFSYPGAFGHPKYPQAYTLPISPRTNKSEE